MFEDSKSFVALSPREFFLIKCLQTEENPELLTFCNWYSCGGKKQFFILCKICY